MTGKQWVVGVDSAEQAKARAYPRGDPRLKPWATRLGVPRSKGKNQARGRSPYSFPGEGAQAKAWAYLRSKSQCGGPSLRSG